MAKIEGRGKLSAEIVLVLNESEAAALDALVGYGFKEFVEVFYEKLGKSYLEPHENGLRSLFESVRAGEGSVEAILKRAKDARRVFNREAEAVPRT